MAVRIKKKLFIKPRICPECGRFAIFGTWWTSQRCHKCHEVRKRKKKTARNHLKRKLNRKQHGFKYGSAYQSARKRTINAHPYCALCGATDNLTTHHVGGGDDIHNMTVLCDECHQAYERWHKKKEEHERLHLWLFASRGVTR